jgi:class 3 adenylate cyclase/tetratricopeptide (TPR) repeat protein
LTQRRVEPNLFVVHCSNCGTELIPGKRFCHVCGTGVVVNCPNCNAVLEAGFRFCPDCGFQLHTAAADGSLPSDAASVPAATDDRLARLIRHIPAGLAEKIRASTGTISGERKLVTVLFCDLVGSTAIAERLDPEEYHDLLEGYLEIAFREIYRYEGIVNQLAGDGFMALFGAPVAHEGAPERAVRAAVAIREALDGFTLQARAGTIHGGDATDLKLCVRIGIHTGPVVVGTVGNDLKMDYSAIGDTTNLAARLQSVAEPGTILMSQATQRLVRGVFDTRPVGPFTVKGKSEPVTASEVRGLCDTATPMDIAVERGLTPLVGRRAELAQLSACYERLNGNLAQLVAIVGAAGTGKSRLVYEFKQQLVGEPAVFFEARCSSLTQALPYAPWVNMLRQYFGLTTSDPASSACAKVAEKLDTLGTDTQDMSPHLCRLLWQVDGTEDTPPEEIKRETFKAVAKLVVGASRRAPVVMIIEDLQWIDESSREMLDLAVAHLDGTRVMLIVTHRPDFQPLWRTPAAFTQLNVRPLSDEESSAIIEALAGGAVPAELRARILVRAEGNPFVTEEITRALVEEGYLVRSNGQTRLTRPAAEIPIPDTVQELIGARLDRLGSRAKRVVQVAAVLGRQFQQQQLTRLLEGEGVDVSRELDELERRGIVHRKNVLSRDEFRFGESLTQEVAYEALLIKDRRQLHERIGQLLEATPADGGADRSALIAEHFARGDDRQKALGALLRAARDAEQLPSYPSAVRFYRQAWELGEAALQDGGDTAKEIEAAALQAAMGLLRMTVLYASSEFPDIEATARRARQLAEKLGDDQALAGACTFHGMILMSHEREKFAEGMQVVEEGLAVARRGDQTLTAISISRALAFAYVYDGRFDLARRAFQWIVGELEQLGHREQLTDLFLGARFMRDSLRYFCDELDASQTGAAETYDLAVRAGNRTIQSNAAGVLAYVCCARGAYPDAKHWADRSMEVAQVIGNVAGIRTAAMLALTARVELAETIDAESYVELIEQGFAARSDMAMKCHMVADTLLAVGEIGRAQRFAEIAYAHAGGRLREAYAATALGQVMLRIGPSRWPEAQRWLEQAIGIAQLVGARSVLAQALIGAGELHAARGDGRTGARQLRQALDICRDLGLGRYQARAERLLAGLNGGLEKLESLN